MLFHKIKYQIRYVVNLSLVVIIVPCMMLEAAFSSSMPEEDKAGGWKELITLKGLGGSLAPEVLSQLKGSTSNSLIVTDLDSTLLKEPVFSNKVLKELTLQLSKSRGWLGKVYILRALWCYYNERTLELVVPEWRQFLQEVSTIPATTIALTRHTINIIPMRMAVEHRSKELAYLNLCRFFGMGLVFKNHTQPLYLKSNNQSPPVFYRGIIMTMQLDKGTALKKFIQAMKQSGAVSASWPDQIIAFEDDVEELKSLIKEAKDMEIPAYGYHYIASAIASTKSPGPENVLQAYILGARGKWLTREQATCWLSKQPEVTQNSFVFSSDVSVLKSRKSQWDKVTATLKLNESWTSMLKREIKFAYDLARFAYVKVHNYLYNFLKLEK